ncbi:UNVERIFIED_CONTAM: hypothetical protein Sradi_2057500 [Sesamum radiatum]|uniref:Uncharacterized protein n=1 Tax=Sesamum radiatum TaxID=300843 RepID=A0AAW2TIR4_SESRA
MQEALMWTVNDLPLMGWSTAGIMGCPVCMDDTRVLICSTVGRRATLTATDSFSKDHSYRRNKKAFTK